MVFAKGDMFKDASLQQEFNKNGIVTFPMLSGQDVMYLENLFYKLTTPLNHEITRYFYTCINSPDFAYKQQIHQEVLAVLTPHLQQIFTEYKVLAATMQAKGVGAQSILDLHQDWTVVDEARYSSATCWIPLVDTNRLNGALFVLPGSHIYAPAYRGGTLPMPYWQIRETVKRYAKPFFVKAGHAIIFNSAVLHYSPANMSNAVRLSAIATITHVDAEVQLLYCQQDKAPVPIEVYRVPENFWLLYNNFNDEKNQKPNGIKLKEITDYDLSDVSAEKFKRLYAEQNKSAGIWNKIYRVFGNFG